MGWLLFVSMFYSCASTRSTTYFQSQQMVDSKQYTTLSTADRLPLRIQPDDMLTIVINSLSDESNALFSRGAGSSGGGSQPLGYPVNGEGDVNLPLVGKIRLAGMTLDEAGGFIKDQLSRYVKDATVNVHVLNHKFTVIGEVARPGIYNLGNNPTTLAEVIGMAGDLTTYGRRDNVMLIRTINNKREVIKLDLTSRQIFNSPYYFIENRDVVYVESRPSKFTTTSRSLQMLPVILSITSTALIVLNFLTR
jgi:polysaccharide export outer membrane protein